MLDNETIAVRPEILAPGNGPGSALKSFFDDFFKDRLSLEARFPRTDAGEMGWVPAVDISETAEEIIIHASLPGVPKDEIRLEIAAESLTLSGRRPGTEDAGRALRRELPSGRFERRLALPACARAAQATASHRDGVLEIRLPKEQEGKAHTVKIQ